MNMDAWLEMVDELFERGYVVLPVEGIYTREQLEKAMVMEVWKSDLTVPQKIHTSEMVEKYLARGVWEKCPHYHEMRIMLNMGKYVPEEMRPIIEKYVQEQYDVLREIEGSTVEDIAIKTLKPLETVEGIVNDLMRAGIVKIIEGKLRYIPEVKELII
jgi:hypothetical protein